MSARFRVRAPGPVSDRLSTAAGEGADQIAAVSRLLSAVGIRFLDILFPPGSSALLTVGLPPPAISAGPGRGFHVPHTRDAAGVGCPLYPEVSGTHTTVGWSPVAACRSSTA
jgi:hypothetical protein